LQQVGVSIGVVRCGFCPKKSKSCHTDLSWQPNWNWTDIFGSFQPKSRRHPVVPELCGFI